MLAYVDVVGPLRHGARVRIDVSALARKLGTGGQAMVCAIDDLPEDIEPPSGGHIVKARYTPSQTMVLAAEEQNSPHHAVLCRQTDLAATPVVACDLHSMLPAVVAGVRMVRPDARVVYVMTDGAALPAAYSMTATGLYEAGWISDIVSSGQAFGGTLEAVSVPSALLIAKHVGGADVVVAAQGPGNAGTGTPWGFSGVDVAWSLTAAATLGGRPIAALRISGADGRGRHCGISHHTRQAVGRLTHVPVTLAVPGLGGGSDLERDLAERVGNLEEAAALIAGERHDVEVVDTTGLVTALRSSPVPLRTMGRDLDADPGPFLAAGAAGIAAVR